MDDRYEYKTYAMAKFHIPDGMYSIEEIETLLAAMKESKKRQDAMLKKAITIAENIEGKWVGLTEPELHEINPTWPAPNQSWDYADVLAFAKAIEAKLKEKNT